MVLAVQKLKPQTLSYVVVGTMLCLGLAVMASPAVMAVTTSTTQTITGYNAPNAQNFVNGFVPLLLPLAFAEIFAFAMFELKRGGDFFVTLWLLGIALGASFGTMVGQIPFAMTIIGWVLLFLWLWAGGQGEGSGASGDAGIQIPKGFD
jgi:hypothetical protein